MTDTEPEPPTAELATKQEPTLGLFEGYGIEIEYMIVDPTTLNVLPIAPSVLQSLGAVDGTVECGEVAWSNELAAHVLELKTNGPVNTLADAARTFPEAISRMNERLKEFSAQLLPTGMHPWMRPDTEFVLYPIDDEGYYGTFDRIFDCRGHGWSNLQSMHINLPFANDDEFARLHSAIRLLLPLLPALSASSPFVEGVRAAEYDHRLLVYRDNAARVPLVSGYVVPEHVVSRQEYERDILEPIYEQLAPLDPEGVLRYEWVNARGAIARFDRMAVEIRVLDSQECPRADLAIAFAVCETLRRMVASGDSVELSARWGEEQLARILWRVCEAGSDTIISEPQYLALFGTSQACTAGEIWKVLLQQLPPSARQSALFDDAMRLTQSGCLAKRIVAATGDGAQPALQTTYTQIADCLRLNDYFRV